jgi:hypothetical protein
MNARKLSTVDTIISPRGVVTAATSSRSAKPSSTVGSVGAPMRSRVLDSTDSPTLAAQPPQSISSDAAIADGRENSGVTSPSGASTWNRCMKRRSIQSFSANIAFPSADHPHLDAMARPSHKLSSERKSDCGR